MAEHEDNHGNTPAAWTAVVIILIGFALGAWSMWVVSWPLFWVSVGLVIVGGIVGKVMQMMGFGTSPQHHAPAPPEVEQRAQD